MRRQYSGSPYHTVAVQWPVVTLEETKVLEDRVVGEIKHCSENKEYTHPTSYPLGKSMGKGGCARRQTMNWGQEHNQCLEEGKELWLES